jgi:tetratricopeptide (TPR) repeat protein
VTINFLDARSMALTIIVWLAGGFYQTIQAKECDETIARALSIQGQVERLITKGETWAPVNHNEAFCPGDRIRVGFNSRANLKLNNDTLLRLSENSSVHIGKPEQNGSNSLDLLEGIAHFISRVQHRLQVNTPYVNAIIEGTEFTVELAPDHAVVTVLEGRVRANNTWGEVLLEGGQKAVAYPGEAPRIEQVVDPLDAVQWTLFYPPVSEAVFKNGSPAGQRSFEAYRRNDLQGAFSALAQAAGIEQDALLLAYRASLHLRVGGVEAARRDLINALRLEPEQADALALLSIIATVQNQRQQALKLAQRAVDADPRGLSPLLALSYARQANFQLTKALEAAKQATESVPDSALAWSQLARLHLMFHHLDEADNAARRAMALAPEQAQPLVILGFIHLIRLDFDGARQTFKRAIDLDVTDTPLPRLGLGLLEIRQGHLAEGRRQLEIAANLDPGNAMIRSYLGKAYYEEKRDEEAATQFALAKQFDELDPTAWFYSAILQQSVNRPIEALDELQTAIDLNDKRAVYRSRYLLDQDEGTRIDRLGRIYAAMGFTELAKAEAYKSLQFSASNYSAHRLLADIPHSIKTKRSETLQSQLLQPLNRYPLKPILASPWFYMDSAGPAVGGFSEYAPFFTSSNGLDLKINGRRGIHDEIGNDLLLSGLHDRIAFSVGKSHYETEGWRENNDIESDRYAAFLQVALTSSTSLQWDYLQEDIESGDRSLYFEPDDFSKSLRNDQKSSIRRVGLHHEFSSNGHLIASAIDQDLRITTFRDIESDLFNLSTPEGDFPAYQTRLLNRTLDSESHSLEFQLIQPFHDHTFIIGAGRFSEDRALTTSELWTVYLLLPDPPHILPYQSGTQPPATLDIDPRFENSYLYSQFTLPARINLTLGVAHNEFDDIFVTTDQTDRKFGLTWEAWENWTFRTAYIESLVSPSSMLQTIEPTQVAGFNQLSSFTPGSEVKKLGLGIDAKIGSSFTIRAELLRTDFRQPKPTISTAGENSLTYNSVNSEYSLAYLHWLATKRLGMYIAYQKEVIEQSHTSPETNTINVGRLGIHYHWPSGFYLKATGDYVDQERDLNDANLQSHFWNINALVGYRFPKRYGQFNLYVTNLFNKEYKGAGHFVSAEPKRNLFAEFTLNF